MGDQGGISEEVYDVVVIGAGIAGLVCADTILSERPNTKLLVLESLERCGGRTKSAKLRTMDVVVDEGGMWLGKTHKLMLGLCERFGVRLVDQFQDGRDVLILKDGTRHLSTPDHQDFPSMGLMNRLDLLVNVFWPLDRLLKEVPDEEPWKCARAQELDGNSLHSYFHKRVWRESSLDMINNIAKALLGCESTQVSLLFALWSIKVAGGLQYVMDCKDGAQEWRLLGGAQQISEGLVHAIQANPNAKVLFNHHVTHVDLINGYYHVRVRGGEMESPVFLCRELVCAGNASVLTREVKFTPRLPTLIEQFGQRTFRGSYGKALVVFREPFWRSKGISGTLINARLNAFASSVLDYCLPDEHRFYALACFFSGDAGIRAAGLTEQERMQGVLGDLSELLAVPRSEIDAQFLEYKERLWHMDPVFQGCSGVIYGPGHFCTFAPAKVFSEDEPGSPNHNTRLHFVGTDVSRVFPGYMEGAAHTGKDMGRRIAKRLSEAS